ncbi:5'-3' exoribonuclease 2 [Gonapodya sp. JEL0774]|nr:5'-3' exoribonuclease 2 [Gonapodya sp. JEL0774]
MGVPALFRWLSTKYPKITTPVVEDVQQQTDEDEDIPVDWSEPNPNGMEFDNLYLDMNGIIHPCCHPEDKVRNLELTSGIAWDEMWTWRPAPETESLMFLAIFKYIDRIVRMIRPRRLLYMAIDGVAPRAKMNQQRSRRFRAAQDAREKEEDEERVRKEWEASHEQLPPRPAKSAFDSNVITPGTPFMENLAVCLRYYVADRMQHDPCWAKIKVVLSDASVAGEGEHKIMDYIRKQRFHPSHDPNTSHVLYGLDADLIMLALVTHEPHFRILREDVFAQESNDRDKCFICGQKGHQAAMCTGKAKQKTGQFDEKENSSGLKPFVFLHVPQLREYLEAELTPQQGYLPFTWSLERALDDWVFLCFFVGNDFLPHLPSLEIKEGAIDSLVGIWKRTLPLMGGYLTDNGELNLGRLDLLMEELGKLEDETFRLRKEKEERRLRNERDRKRRENAGRGASGPDGDDWRIGGHENSGSRKRKAAEAPEILRASVYGEDQLKYAMPLGKGPRAGMLQGGEDETEKESTAINKEIITKKVEERDKKKANADAAAFLRERLMGKGAKEQLNKASPSEDGNRTATENLKPEDATHESTSEVVSGKEDTGMEESNERRRSEVVSMKEDAYMEESNERRRSEVVSMKEDAYMEESYERSGSDQAPEPTVDVAEMDIVRADDGDTESLRRSSSTPDISLLSSDDSGIPGLGAVSTPEATLVEESDTEVEETMIVSDVPIAHKKVVDQSELVQVVEEATGEPVDEVRLWEPGWKGRYYRSKFGVDVADTAFRRSVVGKYIEGLCWVLKYYYQGVQSWPWYYPFHYSPFASDCTDLVSLQIKFDYGTPFAPLEQLMGVLPKASDKALPVPWRDLMREEDSVIGDFYPTRFKIDLNGKKYAWQGVALLPFIDEKRLFAALQDVYPTLTPEEVRRNSRGYDRLFVHCEHELFDEISILYKSFEGPQINSKLPLPEELLEKAKALKSLPEHIMGLVVQDPEALVPGATLISPLKREGQPDIFNLRCLDVVFFNPQTPREYVHKGTLLPGVKMPPKILSSQDVYWVRLGGTNRGRGGRGGRGGGPRLTDGAMRMASSGMGSQGHHDQHGIGYGRSQSDGYWQRGDDYRGQDLDRRGGYGRGGRTGYGRENTDSPSRPNSRSSGDRSSLGNSYNQDFGRYNGSSRDYDFRGSRDSRDSADPSGARNSGSDNSSRSARDNDRSNRGYHVANGTTNVGAGWRPSHSYEAPVQNGGGWAPSSYQHGYGGQQGYRNQQTDAAPPGGQGNSGTIHGGGNLGWSRNVRGRSK